MGQFLVTIALLGLLIVAGVYVSVRIHAHRLQGKGGFRRIRRLRKITPMPDGTTVEETIIETTVVVDEEAPVEEA